MTITASTSDGDVSVPVAMRYPRSAVRPATIALCGRVILMRAGTLILKGLDSQAEDK